jgi:hypothetical protein
VKRGEGKGTATEATSLLIRSNPLLARAAYVLVVLTAIDCPTSEEVTDILHLKGAKARPCLLLAECHVRRS